MSTEERLSRLGLLHLQGNPAALQAELEKRSAAYQVEVDAWHEKREAEIQAALPEAPAVRTPLKPVGTGKSASVPGLGRSGKIPGLTTQSVPGLITQKTPGLTTQKVAAPVTSGKTASGQPGKASPSPSAKTPGTQNGSNGLHVVPPKKS